MIQIPAGSFIMGSDDSTDERPPHKVTLDAFLMDAAEVTQQEYEELMGINPSEFKSDGTLPVENVTWYDAVLYCNGRSKKDSLEPVYRYNRIIGAGGNGCTSLEGLETDFSKNGFRLPTEAEREYASRAGATTEYYWGDAMDGDYAWWSANAEGKTHPVKTKKPNAWGLFDMSGNVWEWCSDLFDKLYYAKSPEKSPLGVESSITRAVRGGSWNDVKAHHLRCCARGDFPPANRARFYGFRCVRMGK
jgi:formylglycine-generating enzyme